MKPETPRLERFLRRQEVVQLTGLPQSTIYMQMAAGHFPRNVRISPRLVAWRESEILEWQRSKIEARSNA